MQATAPRVLPRFICYADPMPKIQKHIIAIGGLSPTGDNAPLFDYALKLINQPRPKLGFIGTASGDSAAYLHRFEEIAARLTCQPSHLPFFSRTPALAEWVAEQDVILVGGGNTKSMLAVWKDWGLPPLLQSAWEHGTVLTGWSAGAICWFEQGVTDSWADRLAALDGLGFLPGSCCPHYSGEPDRRPECHRLLLERQLSAGIAIDDMAAVHFLDESPHAVLSLTPEAGASQVDLNDGDVAEQPLPIRRVTLSEDFAL